MDHKKVFLQEGTDHKSLRLCHTMEQYPFSQMALSCNICLLALRRLWSKTLKSANPSQEHSSVVEGGSDAAAIQNLDEKTDIAQARMAINHRWTDGLSEWVLPIYLCNQDD